MVMLPEVSYLGVLILTLVGFVFGWFWYGFLMKDMWLSVMKFSRKQISTMKKGSPKSMVSMFVLNLVSVYVLFMGVLAFGAVSFIGGMIVGFMLWAGFTFICVAGKVAWEGRDPRILLVDGLYGLLYYSVLGGIAAIW